MQTFRVSKNQVNQPIFCLSIKIQGRLILTEKNLVSVINAMVQTGLYIHMWLSRCLG